MTTIRIYGGQLGETDTVIDATIENVSISGVATLKDTNGTRTWDIKLEKLREYIDTNAAAKHEDISHPKHDIWKRLDGVQADLETPPFDDISFNENVLEIFKMVIRIMTEENT